MNGKGLKFLTSSSIIPCFWPYCWMLWSPKYLEGTNDLNIYVIFFKKNYYYYYYQETLKDFFSYKEETVIYFYIKLFTDSIEITLKKILLKDEKEWSHTFMLSQKREISVTEKVLIQYKMDISNPGNAWNWPAKWAQLKLIFNYWWLNLLS